MFKDGIFKSKPFPKGRGLVLYSKPHAIILVTANKAMGYWASTKCARVRVVTFYAGKFVDQNVLRNIFPLFKIKYRLIA